MIEYLLDTDACIYLIKRKPEAALRKLQELPIETIGISSISLSELEYGIEKSAQVQRNRMALAQFVAPLAIVAYDDNAAAQYGKVRAELERRGTPIGALDTLIAAHALALGTTLVTNNVREFERVDGLTIENWFT